MQPRPALSVSLDTSGSAPPRRASETHPTNPRPASRPRAMLVRPLPRRFRAAREKRYPPPPAPLTDRAVGPRRPILAPMPAADEAYWSPAIRSPESATLAGV